MLAQKIEGQWKWGWVNYAPSLFVLYKERATGDQWTLEMQAIDLRLRELGFLGTQRMSSQNNFI